MEQIGKISFGPGREVFPDPKPKTFRSEDYLDLVRSKGCLVCGAKAEPHHISLQWVICSGTQECERPCFHGEEPHEREDIWDIPLRWCTEWFFCDKADKSVRCTKVKEKP